MAKRKDTYCPAPWHGGFFTYDQQSVCCAYDVVTTSSIVEFYKSDLVKNLKHEIAAGIPPPSCKTRCFDLEEAGGKSQRRGYIENFSLNGIEFVDDPDAQSLPQYVEIRLSNLCNFKCRICNPTWSTMIGHELKQHPRLIQWYQSRNTHGVGRSELVVDFFDELIDMIPHLRWINFTGGEPMVIPEVLRLIEEIRQQQYSQQVAMQFTTNASVINPRITETFDHFRGVQLTLSIDGIGPVGEYIRHGTVWPTVVKNCNSYGEMNLAMPTLHIGINISLSAYAALAIDETMAWVCDYNTKYHCNSTDMNYVKGVLDPLNLKGEARQKAIDSMQRAIVIIEDFVSRNPDKARKILLVSRQISSLRQRMIDETASNQAWQQFRQFTQDFDLARNEDFKNIFGFEI